MNTERLILTKQDGICTLTLNRPKLHNAMDTAMQVELITTLKKLDTEEQIKVVVLRGAGKSFCSGADIKSLADHDAQDRNMSILQPRIFETIANLKKVAVASVHGVALGAGFGIVAACDLAIASEDATFGLPEIDLGFFPMAMIGPLMRSIGRKPALELFFTGKRIDAQEAKRIGLLNAVVLREKLEQSTLDLVKIIATKQLDPIMLGKEALATTMDMEYSKLLRYCADMLVVAAAKRRGKAFPPQQ